MAKYPHYLPERDHWKTDAHLENTERALKSLAEQPPTTLEEALKQLARNSK